MAASAHKGENRQTVVFATRKGDGTAGKGGKGGNSDRALLIKIFPTTIAKLGLKVATTAQKQVKNKAPSNPNNKNKKTRTDQVTLLRGSKGGKGSMKLDAGIASGKQKFISIPVPSEATVKDMLDFATKCKTLKPKFFVTPGGLRHDVDTFIKGKK